MCVLFIRCCAKRFAMVPGNLLESSKFLLKINEGGESESGGKQQSRLSVKIINRKTV